MDLLVLWRLTAKVCEAVLSPELEFFTQVSGPFLSQCLIPFEEVSAHPRLGRSVSKREGVGSNLLRLGHLLPLVVRKREVVVEVDAPTSESL